MDSSIAKLFEQDVRSFFAMEIAEGRLVRESKIFKEHLERGNMGARYVVRDVEIDGVPLALSVMVYAGVNQQNGLAQGEFDMCLYHRELDESFADYMRTFTAQIDTREAAKFDPAPWLAQALAGAREELEESPTFLALREAAQLRAAVAAPRRRKRRAARL